MSKNIKTRCSGFTLIELMVTILIASFVFVGVAMVLADGFRGFSRMNTRVHGEIVNDAYVARLRFDKVCRQGRAGSAIVDGSSTPSLKILYYSMANEIGDADLDPDMYAEFYLNGTDLMLDTGTIVSGTASTTETIAHNVVTDELKFSEVHSKSVQMVLTLDEADNSTDSHSITVTCGSIMHN